MSTSSDQERQIQNAAVHSMQWWSKTYVKEANFPLKLLPIYMYMQKDLAARKTHFYSHYTFL